MASPGIRKRHSRGCASRDGDGCNCKPSWEARVWSKRAGPDGRGGTVSRSFPSYAAAQGWRTDAEHAKKGGKQPVRATTTTVYEAAERLVREMEDGTVLSSRDRPYRPSTIRSYRRGLGVDPEQRTRAPVRVVEAFGEMKLTDVDKHVIQGYANRLRRDGWDPSTVANCLDGLRVIFRVARDRDELATDPFAGVKLAKPKGRRAAAGSPAEAAALIAAAPEQHRALWATFFYAGLRRGEARALRVRDVDFAADVIRVRGSWDDVEGEMAEGKTDAAERDVPLVVAELRTELRRHVVATGRRDEDLVFGRTASEPFNASTVRREALAAWADAGLKPITPHSARHMFASLMIAAGVDAKAISKWCGHSSIDVTYDVYGHLLDDAAQRAEKQVAAFLAAQQGRPGGLRAVD
jgi:integrase